MSIESFLRQIQEESLSSFQGAELVKSFERLAEVASFLSLMNKTLVLLYRGQDADYPLLPSLLRSDWRVFGHEHGRADLGIDRPHYWNELSSIHFSKPCVVTAPSIPSHFM